MAIAAITSGLVLSSPVSDIASRSILVSQKKCIGLTNGQVVTALEDHTIAERFNYGMVSSHSRRIHSGW